MFDESVAVVSGQPVLDTSEDSSILINGEEISVTFEADNLIMNRESASVTEVFMHLQFVKHHKLK